MTLKPGTFRLIPRWKEKGDYGPVVGLAMLPLPDNAREGDLIEVVLEPGGKATWSVKAHDALGKESDSPWPNAFTFDHLFTCGYVTNACVTREEAVAFLAEKQETP